MTGGRGRLRWVLTALFAVLAFSAAEAQPKLARDIFFGTTAEFLRACGGTTVSHMPCMAAFALVETRKRYACRPDTSSRGNPEAGQAKYNTLIHSVTAWLRSRPAYAAKPYAEGIDAAMLALYACK